MPIMCTPCKESGYETEAVMYIGFTRIPMCDMCWPLADSNLREQNMQRVEPDSIPYAQAIVPTKPLPPTTTTKQETREEVKPRAHKKREAIMEEKTSRRVSVVKSTHQEMTVEENNHTALQQEVTALREQMEKLQKQLGQKPFDFWNDHEQMSLDCFHGQDDEGAVLWGAKVPIEVLDAIWYSLSNQAKANLISAIAVARYKVKPPSDEQR